MNEAKKTKISVITSVFNRSRTISDTINSVKSQTHKNIEHIIQDGGSSDGTLEQIRSDMHPKIALEVKKDSGIYEGINNGIKRAKGDIIGLLHSDDIYASRDVLEKIANTMENPDIDGVYGDLDYVSGTNIHRTLREWRSGQYNEKKLKFGWMPPHPTLYLRREVFEKYGLYDTTYAISADYDAILRYLSFGKIKLAYIPEVMVKMRAGGESNASIKKIITKTREDYKALKKNRVGGAYTLVIKNLSKVSQFKISATKTRGNQ